MNDNGCFIELRGNKEALIDGMSTVIDFSEERIVILVKRHKIAINGKRLTMVTMNESRISIDGCIESLEYLK